MTKETAVALKNHYAEKLGVAKAQLTQKVSSGTGYVCKFVSKYRKSLAAFMVGFTIFYNRKYIADLFGFRSTYKSEDSSDFKLDSQFNETIKEYETTCQSLNTASLIPTTHDTLWNVKIPNGMPTYTGDLDSFSKMIYANVKRIRFRFDDTLRYSYILALKGNMCLINTHAIPKGDNLEVEVSSTGYFAANEKVRKTLLDRRYIYRVSDDVSLILLSSCQFRDITPHIQSGKSKFTAAQGMIGGDRVSIENHPMIHCAAKTGEYDVNHVYSYKWPKHAPGQCGLPLLAQVGSGCVIVSIHGAGDKSNSDSFGCAIDMRDIQPIFDRIEKETVFKTYPAQNACIDVEDPISKSAVRHISLTGMDYYGKLPGSTIMPEKSSLRRLVPALPLLQSFYTNFGFVPPERFVPPIFKTRESKGKYINIYNNVLTKISRDRAPLKEKILDKVCDRFVDYVVKGLKEVGITDIKPYTMQTAINGDPNLPAFRRVNTSTAAGYSWKSPKGLHLPVTTDDGKVLTREATHELKAKVAHLMSEFAAHRSVHCISTLSPKDEPRLSSKVDVGKIRLFGIQPIEHVVHRRMFLGRLFSLMAEHMDIFSVGIGIDMTRYSKRIYEKLLQYILEFDFGSYDCTLPFDIKKCTAKAIMKILKALGYNEEALDQVNGSLLCWLFPVISVCLDLFCAPGFQVSGEFGTAETNSICTLFLLMYFWYDRIAKKDQDFFDYVSGRTYGDDVLASIVAQFIKEFNQKTFSKYCLDVFGMECTTSKKGEVEEDFTKKEDMTFLKRKFVF